MQAKWTIRNTGSPSGDRGVDQLAARERQAGLTGMAERLVVLTKPGSCEETSINNGLRVEHEFIAIA
jgi:hypothetical protein